MLGQEHGIAVEAVGNNEHVPIVERKIRVIKERVRGIINTLPYRLPTKLLPLLVLFCVNRINMTPSIAAANGASPWERFYGKKIDYKKNLRAAFGEYCQAHTNMADNTLSPRTTGGLTMYDTGNGQGTWYIYNLNTDRLIRRNKFTILPIPDIVINHLNNMRDTEGAEDEVNFQIGLNNMRQLEGNFDSEEDQERNEVQDYHSYMDAIAQKFITINQASGTYDPVEMLQEEESKTIDHQISDHPIENEGTDVNQQEESPDEIPQINDDEIEGTDTGAVNYQPLRSGLRVNRTPPGTYTRREYGYHLSPQEAVTALGTTAKLSMIREIQQLLDRKSWHPVHIGDLNAAERRSIIPSKLFVKIKYKPSGIFDKVKSRLVAGGHRQDRSLYRDKTSSPTVSTSSVFLIAAIAQRERRSVCTIDIPGAYLNAKIPESTKVRMRLDKFLSEIVIQLDDSYSEYQNEDGTIVVQLDYALYGLVESAILWYDLLSARFKEIGFINNPYDRCVFNRHEQDGSQCSLCVHVDDIMITAASERHLDKVIEDTKSVFGDITIVRGKNHDYLGMSFDFSDAERVKISMTNYVEELIKECKVEGIASSPANNNLFQTEETSTPLNNEDKEYFHSTVAQLLYLAKRVRPDILLAVSYLTTRVQKPTVRDMEKLNRVLKYLNGTKELVLYLSGNNILNITAYIDASYGTHNDYKSHTGIFISIGRGPIYCSSSKQKLNSKSSTEAEMIAVSDGLNHVIWLRNLLEAQGYTLPPSIIFQDNMSAISLLKTGKSQSSTRTRHIAIRFFFIKDRIESREISVQYINTDHMIADILTKPLQGTKYKQLRLQLMGN